MFSIVYLTYFYFFARCFLSFFRKTKKRGCLLSLVFLFLLQNTRTYSPFTTSFTLSVEDLAGELVGV